MDILVTNNPLVETQYKTGFLVEYQDTNMLEILMTVRDKVHIGYKILTHPLSGSLKPNEAEYKTVLLSGTPAETDPQSVTIIEESIQTALKFQPKPTPEQYKKDKQIVDLSLIQSAIGNCTKN